MVLERFSSSGGAGRRPSESGLQETPQSGGQAAQSGGQVPQSGGQVPQSGGQAAQSGGQVPQGGGPALRIESVRVGSARMVCLVRIAPWAPLYTSRTLAQRAVQAFPSIASHACKNNVGQRFSDVMDNTPLPHLLEHIVVELQARALWDSMRDKGSVAETQKNLVLVGTTEWVDKSDRLVRVSVNFLDDLIALRAFSEALSFINGIVVGAEYEHSSSDFR